MLLRNSYRVTGADLDLDLTSASTDSYSSGHLGYSNQDEQVVNIALVLFLDALTLHFAEVSHGQVDTAQTGISTQIMWLGI